MVALRRARRRVELDQHFTRPPALTLWPSWTRITRTTPISSGWMVLAWPQAGRDDLAGGRGDDVNFAQECPANRQAEEGDDCAGDGAARGRGRRLTIISRAAGRKSYSCRRRQPSPVGARTIVSADFMESGLQAMKACITSTALDQLIVRPITTPAALDRDDAGGATTLRGVASPEKIAGCRRLREVPRSWVRRC
jgi:hypothetical protein